MDIVTYALAKGYTDKAVKDANSGADRGVYASKAALLAVAWQTTDRSAPYYVKHDDYAVVLSDESQGGECWQYNYVLEQGGSNNGWTPHFRINESPMTEAQLAALNSGATTTNIGQIATNQAAIGTLENLTTTDKTSLTGAVNEIDAGLDAKVPVYGKGENILINADFRKPVNRNGKAEYSGQGFTVDNLWESSSVRMLIESGGIVIQDNGGGNPYISNAVKNCQGLARATLVLSAVFTDESVSGGVQCVIWHDETYSVWHGNSVSGAGISSVTFTVHDSVTAIDCRILAPVSAKCAAMKLELGSTQTLAHQENGVWVLNEPVNYEREYLRCLPYSPSTGEFVGVNYSNPNLLHNWYFVGGGSQQGGGQFPINQRAGLLVPPGSPYFIYDDPTIQGYAEGYIKVEKAVAPTVWFHVNGIEYVTDLVRCVTGHTGDGYGIDRWKQYDYSNDTSIEVQTDGIFVYFGTNAGNGFAQRHEKTYQEGKRFTASILTTDGLYTKTFVYNDAEFEIIPGKLRLSYADWGGTAFFHMRALSSTKTFKFAAMKLELGSVQTLAHQDDNGNWVLNEVPDYAEELAKCQRYYRRIGSANQYYTPLPVGYAISESTGIIVLPYGMNSNGGTNLSFKGDFVAWHGSAKDSNAPAITAFGGTSTGNFVRLTLTSSGFTVGEPILVQSRSANSYVDLEFEL